MTAERGRAADGPELRVLFLASRFPFPPRRGDQARAFHQVRLLGVRHRVTLLSPASERPDEGVSVLRAFGAEVVTVTSGWAERVPGLFRGLIHGLPLQAALFDSARLRASLRGLLAEGRHDVLHVQLARMAPVLPERVAIPVVIDLVDALSVNMARRAGRDRGLASVAARFDGARLARYERRLCARWDHLTVVSEADRAAIGAFPNLSVNPNGVDLHHYRPPDAPRPPARLAFTGNLGYFPNVDGALWLVREVMPIVWRERPETRIVLAGMRPARALRRLASDPRVEVAADVPDLRPFLSGSTVAVAPLRAGSGQLFKVLEAMACATPVVGTPLALSGLDLRDGQEALVGDSAASFARHVLDLLGDPGRASRIGLAGRGLVEARFGWERSVGALEALYARLVAERRPRTEA